MKEASSDGVRRTSHLDIERWYKWALIIGASVVGVSFAVAEAMDPTPPDACASTYAACAAPSPPAGHGTTAAIAGLILLGGCLCGVLIFMVLPKVGERWRRLAAPDPAADWLAPAAGPLGLLATFLPAEHGKLWLDEAVSCLHGVGPARRAELLRDYLGSASKVILIAWAGRLVRATGQWANLRSER